MSIGEAVEIGLNRINFFGILCLFFFQKLDVTEVEGRFCTYWNGPPNKSVVCIETDGQNTLCPG